jgi:hypothetical protein
MSIKSHFVSVFFRKTGGGGMVDTVKVWFIGTGRVPVPPRQKVTLRDGVRLYHDGMGTWKAEAELPKLLFGHNGRLISSQSELDDAKTGCVLSFPMSWNFRLGNGC